MYLHGASIERIAAQLNTTEAQVEGAIDILMDDPDFRDMGDFDEPQDEYDDSMDGDAESALASAGWGTDEDYGAHEVEYNEW
jgi:hypothetical protein